MVEGEISFGRFRLDLARRELRRDQTLVRLGSRALDILCVLASAEGKVVSKDELMERVWAGVVVEEHNIQVHISALRKAFDEDGDGGSWIVTVPERGYRLLRPREPRATDNTGAEQSQRDHDIRQGVGCSARPCRPFHRRPTPAGGRGSGWRPS